MPWFQNCKQQISEKAPHIAVTVLLNVSGTVSPEKLNWKGCPMLLGFFALAGRKSMHISDITVVLVYSFVYSR